MSGHLPINSNNMLLNNYKINEIHLDDAISNGHEKIIKKNVLKIIIILKNFFFLKKNIEKI